MSDSHENPKPHSRVLYVLLALCFVMGGVFLLLYLSMDVPLRISKETTYVTGPLTADGTRIDYLRAIEERTYPPQMRTDDNGCRILTRAIGPPPTITDPILRAQFYEKLDLAPDHIPPLVYVSEFSFIKNYLKANPDAFRAWEKKYDEYQKTKDSSFIADLEIDAEADLALFIINEQKGKEFERLNEVLQLLDPVLAVLAEAVRKPTFITPYVFPPGQTYWDNNCMSSGNDLYRHLGQSLIFRANYRVDNGDIDGAIDDIITCRRLGRFATKRGDMQDYVIGMWLQGMTFDVGLNANPENPISSEQIKRLLQELDALPDARPRNEMLDEERLQALSLLQRTMEIKGLGLDWNIVMKHYNQIFDQSAHGYLLVRLFYADSFCVGREARSKKWAEKTAGPLLPNVDVGGDVKRRIQCLDNMQRIVLAMLLYEKEHGTLPPTLTTDSDNKPLHSWRVLLLPYFENENLKELYKKIRLDEPWNSEWNKQFHEAEIAVYICPSAAKEREFSATSPLKGQTDYTVLTGTKMLFADESNGEKISGRNTKDFHSDIAMITERRKPICWMDPTQEISFADAKKNRLTSFPFSSVHVGITNFAFKSGRCGSLSDSHELADFMGIENEDF